MRHYDFAQTFHSLYDRAVKLYAGGQRDAGTFFSADEQAWLAAIRAGLPEKHHAASLAAFAAGRDVTP